MHKCAVIMPAPSWPPQRPGAVCSEEEEFRMAKTRLVLSVAFVVVLVLLVAAPGVALAAPLDSPQAAASYRPQASPSNWAACWYRVRWGDTLTRIAFRYGTSIW